MTVMARIGVLADGARTTIIVRHGIKVLPSLLPEILGLMGGSAIAAFLAFFFWHFRFDLRDKSGGPMFAFFTSMVALLIVVMRSAHLASYLGSWSILSIDGFKLAVRRTRCFFLTDEKTYPGPAVVNLRWQFPEVGRPLGDGRTGARIVGPQFRLLWLGLEPLGEVVADIDGKPFVFASGLTQCDGARLIDEMRAAYPFRRSA